MPNFNDINNVYAPLRPLTLTEIQRAIKYAIASEYEAIQIYQQIVESTDNSEVKTIMDEIARDEMHHAGKLSKLLEVLAPAEAEQYAVGIQRAEQVLGITK